LSRNLIYFFGMPNTILLVLNPLEYGIELTTMLSCNRDFERLTSFSPGDDALTGVPSESSLALLKHTSNDLLQDHSQSTYFFNEHKTVQGLVRFFGSD